MRGIWYISLQQTILARAHAAPVIHAHPQQTYTHTHTRSYAHTYNANDVAVNAARREPQGPEVRSTRGQADAVPEENPPPPLRTISRAALLSGFRVKSARKTRRRFSVESCFSNRDVTDRREGGGKFLNPLL